MTFEDKSKYGVFPAGIGIDKRTTGDLLGVYTPTESKTVNAVIANGASLSSVIDLGDNWQATKIFVPAAIDGTKISFQISLDGVTFYNLMNDSGVEIAPAMAVNSAIHLDVLNFAGLRYLKLRTGVAATPVVQTAARTFKVFALCL